MLFEEFFKKKKIDLNALEKGERALFSEFKTHFDQMGEKSFDHTKKYWFNKLRRQFPLAPEIKTEKLHITNPIAEQTVTESLIETIAAPSPKIGFTPKFKAANIAKPVEDKTIEPETTAIEPTENVAIPPAPKLGFVPKFKAGITGTSAEATEDKKEEEDTLKSVATPPASKLGFVPKFKTTNTAKPAEAAADEKAGEERPKTEVSGGAVAPTEPKLGFTPKFRTANTAKSTEASEDKTKKAETAKTETPENVVVPPMPKLGFTPKFRAATDAKPVDDINVKKEDKPEENTLTADEPPVPAENARAKPAYKPRFNMKNVPPKKEEN